ncbi:MAG: argininosuccinate lyase [Spirochaetes bacterium]|nr:MAG: argininosuccinate lyase [Spirochaetota bacterium]
MTGPKNEGSGKLWGGRFSGESSDITEKISASVHFDARLYRQDIRGSIAHAGMLKKIGLLNADELVAIVGGLKDIEREIGEGRFDFLPSREDVHMNIEAALTERIGEAGRKLHTARSRNDQVALDLRLYLRDESREIARLLGALIGLLADRAHEHIDVVMPGYTHLQVAQPVRFSHHLLAHAWAYLRDLARLRFFMASADLSPLGAGALAGVNYKTDRDFVKDELGFAGITPNSMDSVSDRDFALDFLYFAAVLGTHLSRQCEELVIWSTAEFGFVRLSDAVTTGSSIMPQKRNPDIAELIRGKSGRLNGNLVSLLTTLKGLPLAYNRDLQEDKEPLFDSVDTVKLSLLGMREMIAGMQVQGEHMKRGLFANFSTATDLADYLAAKGVPFRSAHEIVGSLVRHCEDSEINFFELPLDVLKGFSTAFGDDIREVLNPETSPERKLSKGSTARPEVETQIVLIRERLEAIRDD